MLKNVNRPICLCVSLQGDMRLLEGHVLELQNASYDTAGMYICKVTVPSLPELREEKSVQISVRGESLPTL